MTIADISFFILLFLMLLTYSTLKRNEAGWGQWLFYALLLISGFITYL